MKQMMKLELPPNSESPYVQIKMSKGAVIRHLAVHATQMSLAQASGLVIPVGLPPDVNTIVKEVVVLWIEADPTEPTEDRTFVVLPDNVDFPPDKLNYIGTFVVHGGRLALHLYEKLGILQ